MAFTGAQFYSVMVGVVPLYVAILLGYGSLRWWKLVQEPQQCVGIAQLNTYFLIPVYVFHVLAFNDPYTLSLRILAADFLSKAVPLCMLCVWAVVPSSLYSSTKQEEVAARRRKFDWAISFFMLATLPNTVIVEIPLLQPMYGKIAIQGSICIISAQCLFWYNVCIVLFEVQQEAKVEAAGAHHTAGGDCTESSSTFTIRHDHEQFESSTIYKLEEIQQVKGETSPEQQLGRLSMLQQVCKRVLFRLLRLPILYGSVLGFTYSLLASRWGFNMPQIVEASLQIFTNMTLGTSMFVLGLFMANQPHLLPCGLWKTIEGIVIRFGVGPAIMTIASVAVGIRGNSLRFVITQAAVPQGIITFILANEYNMHADIFATAVSFQMLIFLPFVLLYYILLGLL
ncbi:unnamed protein product [Sphagnum jensenii]